MVHLNMKRYNKQSYIDQLRRDANVAWSYAMSKDEDSMAGELAEKGAMEADELAFQMQQELNRGDYEIRDDSYT